MAGTCTLTAKQLRFVEEYLIDFDGAAAAKRAGYKGKHVKSIASRLVNHSQLAAAINRGKAKLSKRAGNLSLRIISELSRIAFFDPRKCFAEGGILKAIRNMSADEAAAISSVEVFEEWAGSDDERTKMGETKKIRFADKMKALELLLRYVDGINPADLIEEDEDLHPDERERLLNKLAKRCAAPESQAHRNGQAPSAN